MSELRWNRLLGEWVATAENRQDRMAHPAADACPLCPAVRGGPATEIGESAFDVAVFENRFPSFRPDPEEPSVNGTVPNPVRPSRGVCEIVVYTPKHGATLAGESHEHIYKLVRVWADRFQALGTLDFVKYVFVFENRGEEVGVAIDHPHGQIYAYPFVPPVVSRELEVSRVYEDTHGRCLLCDSVAEERRDGRRVVAENEFFTAFVPFAARYPYEVHVVSRRHVQSLAEMHDVEHRGLAAMLKAVLVGYDRLFDRPFPYVMAMHQRPTDGHRYDHYHFHVEFYPPLLTATKIKHLGGSEIGAGLFVNDTTPEAKADELREVVPDASWPR
jgi:UDPglucose--hexose-1-phosphate uridylyltransferase